MDFEAMLLDAMKQGKSLEDVMKEVSTAANKIEKDRAATAARYDIYTRPLSASYINELGVRAFLTKDKISTRDMAVAITHFMCQNVPGYSKALAKNDTDPIDLYQKLLESQMRIAKILTDHKDLPAKERGKILFEHLLDETIFSLMNKTIKEGVEDSTTTSNVKTSNSWMNAATDVERIAKFFEDMDLA